TEKKVSVLMYVLENGADEDLRMAVAIVLGYFDTAESRSKLSQLLNDGSEFVRVSAAGALGILNDESGYEAAVRAVGSNDMFMQSRGIMALGYIGKEEGREKIMLAGKDLRLGGTISVALNQLDLTQSRAVARTRGGEIEDRTAKINGLKEGLNDTRVAVREWALKGLILDLDRNNEEVKAILIEIAKNKNHRSSRSVCKELETRGIEW
ncbi:MAG: HEAT repeat domain-containing protein, partial [bacterium]